MRLNLKQKDKNPLYNQQTKARKYNFSNPTESLERKLARQCRACSWEDTSSLYLFLHKRRIIDEGETGFPAEGWGSVEMFFPYHKKPWNTLFKWTGFSQNNKAHFYSSHGCTYLNMEGKEAVPLGITWNICWFIDEGRSIRTLDFVGAISLKKDLGVWWGCCQSNWKVGSLEH